MTRDRIDSWIFLALALAEKDGPARYPAISAIADGINHAVPTHHELQSALSSLIRMKLVEKHQNRYSLTAAGREVVTQTSAEGDGTLLTLWHNLEAKLGLR